MKRLLWLAVVLLLCGCTAQPPRETEARQPQTASAPTQYREPVGIYAPFSDLEIRTDGAVRYYLPEAPDVYGMAMFHGDVLVFSGTEQTTLTRYSGETLIPTGRIALDCFVDPRDSSFQSVENGITYYDSGANTLVYLDRDLKEVSRLELSPDLTGKPILSSDRTQIFYCTADAVRVLDLETGLDRLLKSISYASQSAEAVLLDDTILRCDLKDSQGGDYVIFLSTENGQLLHELDFAPELTAKDRNCCFRVQDGLLELVIFGAEAENVRALYPADPFAKPWILPNCSSAVTVAAGEEAVVLDHYALETGLRTASVALPAGIVPVSMHNGDADKVYLLAMDSMAGCPVILLWDCSSTRTGDETCYTGPWYTPKAPDEAGLAACADRATEIGERYGVSILVGREAAATEPEDYSLEYEHQVGLIRRELEALEGILSRFPEGFFAKLPGKTKICIVRSITGNASSGSVAKAQGIQFWDGRNAYVVLAAGDSLQQSFCHEIFHIIDSKVLSTNRIYYRWENLNPEGCEYFEDFTSYLTADVSQYLQDADRAFIDAYSLCYPREDRARIMEYACMEGNAHYFQSETMQNKLKTLCEGIRKAFGLEKYQQPILWEQYLSEPLT